MRCTSGCLDTRGVLPVSKNLDSMGFMVKTPSLLGRAAELLQLPGKKDWRGDVIKIYLARDLFSNWRGEEGFAMYAAIAKACLKWAGPEMVEEFDLSQFLDAHAGDWKEFAGQDGDVYEGLRQAGLCIGKHELAECHRSKDDHSERNETSENETSPSASQVGDDDLYKKALKIRSSVQEAFKAGIRENKLVVTPLLLRPPIPRSSSLDELHQFESECQRLCALASLVGCPQVNFPVHSASGQLFSVAIMSLNKSDRPLLAITEKLIDQITKMMAKNEPERTLAAKEPASKKHANGKHTDDREAEAEKFRHLGNDCYKEGRFEEAIAAYTQAIRRHPKAVYYSNRAQAYSNLMDFEAAEADCTAALALDSVNAKALLRRGFAREGMNKMAEAKKDFLQVRPGPVNMLPGC
ncbi:unnamed protein product [Ostreobium quekettii]|uniref:Uncharacterized protein n=1 Tax=Ostreobium quekettii TaxID=121088 RepID=A0A8S1J4A6_9CHLO|nr:unnamed protein product [Ostreobium quekettii]